MSRGIHLTETGLGWMLMKTTFLKNARDRYETVGSLCPSGLDLAHEIVDPSFKSLVE